MSVSKTSSINLFPTEYKWVTDVKKNQKSNQNSLRNTIQKHED